MEIAQGHQAVMPYLMVENARKFTEFCQKVFNAQLTFSRLREDNITVMHSEIQISGCTIMFCDATDQWKVETSNLFIYVEDANETFQKAIEAGAAIVSEIANQDYGRSGGVKDPFGNVWWITSILKK
ncbi:Uncharacterized conserved protein PhnB, glyoxalase superfamily [Pseudarcicella hirudinis]|uniref:Uncharacterized conserved protein PhnB, glyoxalase superfamily n=1 Tax=Pseudarcicella hirudinis TaxID=1079859 RepID=A0A1I5YCY6_9BACT|nr:VOC family protein [Pseudarcicella hirudinis]SFQ42058.1 Uncharacterized conserved protein PhnB, glyoxalase superfamily [Pseudarcicella hirudinis]